MLLEIISNSLGPMKAYSFDMDALSLAWPHIRCIPGRQFVVVMSPTLQRFSGFVFFFIALGQLRSHRGKFEQIQYGRRLSWPPRSQRTLRDSRETSVGTGCDTCEVVHGEAVKPWGN